MVSERGNVSGRVLRSNARVKKPAKGPTVSPQLDPFEGSKWGKTMEKKKSRSIQSLHGQRKTET